MAKRTKKLTVEQQAGLAVVKAAIRARLDASGFVAGVHEAAWEKCVSDTLNPLAEALERGIAESPYNPEREGVE
jgi:hypothetical protein